MLQLSIITVNYNNAQGLKETLQSVASQDVKGIEHLVIDGASSDESTHLLKQHSASIQYVSEPDTGVYEAMNKGIALAKGQYILFLNSGDVFFNNTVLASILPKLDSQIAIYYGDLVFKSATEEFTKKYPKKLDFSFFLKDSLPHPSSCIRSDLFDTMFLYTESFKIISDWEFFIHAICKENVTYKHLNETIAIFGMDGMSNDPANKEQIVLEKEQVFQQHFRAYIDDANTLARQQKIINRSDVQTLLDFKESKWARRIAFRALKLIHRLFIK